MKQKVVIILSAVLVLALAVGIFILSNQPAPESSQSSEWVVMFVYRLTGLLFSEEFIRSMAHFCEFALLGFLVHNLLFRIYNRQKHLVATVFSVLYAVSDEIHQLFVPGRACQFTDVCVDSGGVLLGTTVFLLLIFLAQKIKQHKEKSQGE